MTAGASQKLKQITHIPKRKRKRFRRLEEKQTKNSDISDVIDHTYRMTPEENIHILAVSSDLLSVIKIGPTG